jgi:hypothetical protein
MSDLHSSPTAEAPSSCNDHVPCLTGAPHR